MEAKPTKGAPSAETVKELFTISKYKRFLVFAGIYMMALVMPAVVLPAYGASWFCRDRKCNYDYETYNFYSSLFRSVSGAMSFFFIGFTGLLSDKFGRKIFLILIVIFSSLAPLSQVFDLGMWTWFILQAIASVFTAGSTSPVFYSYISDVVPQNLSTVGFSLLMAISGCTVIFGSLTAAVISIAISSRAAFIAMVLMYAIGLGIIIKFIKESLPSDKRISLDLSKFTNINPFKPLLYVNANPIMFWTCITVCLQCIPIAIVGVTLVYFSDQTNVKKGKSNILSMATMVGLGVAAMLGGALMVPRLRKTKMFGASSLNLAMLGLFLMILCQFLYSFVSYFGHNYSISAAFVVFGSIFFGLSTVCCESSLRAELTKYTDPKNHGLALSVMQSYASLTGIIVPFAYGYTYNYSKNHLKVPALIFYVNMILLSIAILFVHFPLKSAVHAFESNSSMPVYSLGPKSTMADESLLSASLAGGFDSTNNNEGDKEDDYQTFRDDL